MSKQRSSPRHNYDGAGIPQGYSYEEKWTCCQCSEAFSAGMDVMATPCCPTCGHYRCSFCSVQRVKRRVQARVFRPRLAENWDMLLSEVDETLLDKRLIPLVPALDKSHPLYPLDLINDSELLRKWHDCVLKGIESKPDTFATLNAIHLLRQGESNEGSVPTILASVQSLDSNEELRNAISNLIDVSERNSYRISFDCSSVRRTSGNNQLPPICKAQNTAYQEYPSFGASVGIQGRNDCTATLGGYLIVDGEILALTVDHIVPARVKHTIFLTHPSEQECSDESREWKQVQDYLNSAPDSCCPQCKWLRAKHIGAENLYKPVGMCRGGCLGGPDRCACRKICLFEKAKDALMIRYPREILGLLFGRSKTRSRYSTDGSYMVEMDWALFGINQWPIKLDAHVLERQSDLRLAKIAPGAAIRASCRTSGNNRLGMINTAMSLIHQGGGRFTREWTVVRDQSLALDEWIMGGIGVDGDSGAWIIDRNESCLYGMAWGRHQVGLHTLCLFTPIDEIVADIKQLTGAQEVHLPGKEASVVAVAEGKGKGKMQEVDDLTAPLTIRSMVREEEGTEQEQLDVLGGKVRT